MREQWLAKDTLMPQSAYVRVARGDLPPEVFAPARSRLLVIPVYLAVIAALTIALTERWIPLYSAPLVMVLIGVSFAALTFVGHEAVHGSIVRGRTARLIVGWIGFLPFVVSPRLWAAWHDRVHHATANAADDPDMYPTIDEYRASSRIRWVVDAFSLGGRRWQGIFSLIFGFSVQSMHQLVVARSVGFLRAREHRFAIAETAAGLAVWAAVAAYTGPLVFLFVFVLPLGIANACVMAFILTNHGLSPRVEINDPLVSGLSVTAPRWIELITLNFGYHVEHHLFPAMSSRHARKVCAVLRKRWPERYQSMPLVSAVSLLHRTSRLYKDAVTLVDPRTGEEFPTLLPGTPRQPETEAPWDAVPAAA